MKKEENVQSLNSELKTGLGNGIGFAISAISWSFIIVIFSPLLFGFSYYDENCYHDTIYYYGTDTCVPPSAFDGEDTVNIMGYWDGKKVPTALQVDLTNELGKNTDSVCYYKDTKQICLHLISEFKLDMFTIEYYSGDIKKWGFTANDYCDRFLKYNEDGSTARGDSCSTTIGVQLGLPNIEYNVEDYTITADDFIFVVEEN